MIMLKDGQKVAIRQQDRKRKLTRPFFAGKWKLTNRRQFLVKYYVTGQYLVATLHIFTALWKTLVIVDFSASVHLVKSSSMNIDFVNTFT